MKKIILFMGLVLFSFQAFVTQYTPGYMNPQLPTHPRCTNSVCAGDDRAPNL